MKSLGLYDTTRLTVIIQIFSHVLAYTNSCVNPILYAFLSENFRKAFRKVSLNNALYGPRELWFTFTTEDIGCDRKTGLEYLISSQLPVTETLIWKLTKLVRKFALYGDYRLRHFNLEQDEKPFQYPW